MKHYPLAHKVVVVCVKALKIVESPAVPIRLAEAPDSRSPAALALAA